MRALVFVTNRFGLLSRVPSWITGLRIRVTEWVLSLSRGKELVIDLPSVGQRWNLGSWQYLACPLGGEVGMVHLIYRQNSPEAIRLMHALARAQ